MQTATSHKEKQLCHVQSCQISQRVRIEAGESALSSTIKDKAEEVYREENRNFVRARVLELLVRVTCQGRNN